MRAIAICISRGAALIGLALVAGSAHAQSGEPVWTSLPTNEEALAVFPAAALRSSIGGEAFLACEHDKEGVLVRCKLVGEYPNGQGFGAAGLALTPKFRLNMKGPAAKLAKIDLPLLFPSQAPSAPLRPPAFLKPMGRYKGLAPAGPYWPERALRMGQGGLGTIDCMVGQDGGLSGCRLVADRPLTQNFGLAMMRMAETGWMTAGPAPEGVAPPADGYWRFTVEFPPKTLKDAPP